MHWVELVLFVVPRMVCLGKRFGSLAPLGPIPFVVFHSFCCRAVSLSQLDFWGILVPFPWGGYSVSLLGIGVFSVVVAIVSDIPMMAMMEGPLPSQVVGEAHLCSGPWTR